MKKILFSAACILFSLVSTVAQAPQKFSFQSVFRDAGNAVVANTNVGVQVSILQGSPAGSAVYVETHTPTTNVNGLASFDIGDGTVTSGVFASINWANGPYFIQIEADLSGGTNYVLSSVTQMMSVPYALYAENVANDNVYDGDTTYWKVDGNNIYFNTGKVGIGVPNLNTLQSYLTLHGEVGISSPTAHAHFLNKNYVNGSPGLKLYTSSNALGGFYGIQSTRVGIANDGNLVLNQFGGNVGIGDIDPQRSLHVKDVLRLEPRATAPTSPSKGDIYFDDTLNKLRVYDGTAWQNCH